MLNTICGFHSYMAGVPTEVSGKLSITVPCCFQNFVAVLLLFSKIVQEIIGAIPVRRNQLQ